MALATGLAFGAAAASGVALGASCSVQPMARRLGDAGGPVVETAVAGGRPRQSKQPQQEVNEDASRWEGFSMEEARAHADEGQSMVMAKTPTEVFADLQRGNTRFWTGRASRPEASAFERRALLNKQFPSVAVLACADSRVPTEMVFDQGLGDLFVVRVAGNGLDTATQASLQFAVNHLKVKVLVVLGHELCGAIKAAQLPDETLEEMPTQLGQALKGLKAGLDLEGLKKLKDPRALDREAVTCNVKRQVETLCRDKSIIGKVRNEELIVVGGFYELSSGIVDFFSQKFGPDA